MSPQTRKSNPMNNETMTTLKSALLSVMLPLLFAGCASTPPSPDMSESHPANPQAAQSPVPPFEPTLLAVTNMVMVKPVTEPAPEHQHGQDAKPETATPPKHDHH
jgi:hypothetical protein